MKKSLVFLLGVVLGVNGYAQDIIFQLHPLVGDTIDKNEKFNYLLFENIRDADFSYGIIKHTNDAYFLTVHAPNHSVSTLEIDSTELKQYIAKLDLVLEYYTNQGKKDSTKINLNPDITSENDVNKLNSSLLNEQSRDRIMKEARTQSRIKGDAERFKNRKDHSNLFSGSGYVEFPAIKTKKRNKK